VQLLGGSQKAQVLGRRSLATGDALLVGPAEKMSKSKKLPGA
jgi:hypothetical protein